MTMWTLPIDLKRYDTAQDFTVAEKTALGTWFMSHRSKRGASYLKSSVPLERFYTPLQDVFNLIGLHGQAYREALDLFFVEMHRSKLSYWAWTTEQWVRFIHGAPHGSGRGVFVMAGYLLCGFTAFDRLPGMVRSYRLATLVFGKETIDASIARVVDIVIAWGYGTVHVPADIQWVLCRWFLENHSPVLEDLTLDVVAQIERLPKSQRFSASLVSRVLYFMGILKQPLELRNIVNNAHFVDETVANIPEEWLSWAQRWQETAVLQPGTRREVYLHLLQMGRWLQQTHPDITSPAQWTRDVAAEYVAAVDRMKVGQLSVCKHMLADRIGKPLSARGKAARLYSARKFFSDCQEWRWIPVRFDPVRSLRTPPAVTAQIGPDPRIIADDVWAKLVWAGLNLCVDDLPHIMWTETSQRASFYPFEMVRAVALLWLFAGLRQDEIVRLRLGCVSWQVIEQNGGESRVCLLRVPINKTSTAFSKPVSRLVGEAIQGWEKLRPMQPEMLDKKTGERVHFLFAYRGNLLGRGYINHSLIPVLCTKAGVPIHDARGAISSHRARATIASQLANAKDPMSLLELQEWLGHSSANSTRAYVKLTPVTLTKAYTDAGYLDRNLRTIQVLLDRDALQAGAPSTGEPYLFYDLGHGYCTYDFFDKCPHRMACAKCSFYRPKGSSQAQLLEAKANLQRMIQEIPLTEEERAAAEDGVAAVEQLCAKLADIPTPAGPTPRELAMGSPSIIPLTNISTRAPDKKDAGVSASTEK